MKMSLNVHEIQISELEKLMLAKNVEIASGVQLLRERDDELGGMRAEVEEAASKMEESEKRAEEARARLEEALAQPSEAGDMERKVEDLQQGREGASTYYDHMISEVS